MFELCMGRAVVTYTCVGDPDAYRCYDFVFPASSRRLRLFYLLDLVSASHFLIETLIEVIRSIENVN